MGNRNSSADDSDVIQIREDADRVNEMTKYYIVKSDQRRQALEDGEWNRSSENKRGMHMLKSIFKQLDPTVMKTIADVQGEVELSIKYDRNNEVLYVNLLQCRDLRTKDLRTKLNDPYVKCELYPDYHGQQDRQSRIIHGTNNPVFNEIFSFNVNKLELEQMTLVVQVWDYDPAGTDDFLGETLIKMKSFDFEKERIDTAWYTLNMETNLAITGDLEASLRFHLPHSLYVTVHRSSGLSARNDGSLLNSFVKLTIPGVGKIHKTQIKEKTLDPVWEETFEFNIPQEDLATRFMLLEVMDEDFTYEHEPLGQVIIELNKLDVEQGLHSFSQLADLRNSELYRSRWSKHATAQEFREAFVAHAVSKQSSFLFQNHNVKKTVTVTCRKAKAKGKIKIIDGIPVY